jgi:hypothetical protein
MDSDLIKTYLAYLHFAKIVEGFTITKLLPELDKKLMYDNTHGKDTQQLMPCYIYYKLYLRQLIVEIQLPYLFCGLL